MYDLDTTPAAKLLLQPQLLHPHQTQHQQHVSVWERHSSFQIACMVLSIFFWFFSFTAAFCAITISRWRYSGQHERSRSSRLSKQEAPGVSILRPLRGIDCNMYENLASSFRQDYPNFEIIFSVAKSNDPAIAVVRDLMNKFPRIDARIIIGERIVGINPKINNMIQSYETAKNDILWVLDSNVYVDPGCMGRSVDKMMKQGVGLVHHLPFGVQPQTLGSELELMFLDTVHAKMYLFINWTGLASCVVGKSSLYRRSDLNKVGGLIKFGKYMAEDNLIATEIFNMGYKHEMTSDLAYQSLGAMTLSDYFLRRARWTRIRKYTVTAATIVEPFIEMVGCGLVASYGFNLLWQTHFLNFLAFHIVIWFLIDLSMYQALSGEKVDNLRGFLMAWCLREVAALPLYVYAVIGSTVDWRNQTFLLCRDGTVKPLLDVVAPSLPISAPTTTVSSVEGAVEGIESSESTTSSATSMSCTANPIVPPIIPSSLTSVAFAQLANTVVPSSTQMSLRNFFRRPAVISIVSSTFAVIHFVVDILIKSQRNGNDEDEDDDEDDDNDDELLSEDELMMDSNVLFKGGEANSVMVSDAKKNRHAGARDGSPATASVLKLRRAPLRRKSSLRSIGSGSEGGGSSMKSKKKYYGAMADEVCDTDDSSAPEHGEHGIVPRRSERIRMRMASRSSSFSSATASSNAISEYGRQEAESDADEEMEEEDALSKAVEPYLSDSLSRRGRIRRELSSSSQFLII
ncbi:hypothetical protein EDD11_009578 [Mortierella claussenii]|nr:hypothetical protein EDD11_009578 [Mortierella claussenii]